MKAYENFSREFSRQRIPSLKTIQFIQDLEKVAVEQFQENCWEPGLISRAWLLSAKHNFLS
jgi:hypothetical protein